MLSSLNEGKCEEDARAQRSGAQAG